MTNLIKNIILLDSTFVDVKEDIEKCLTENTIVYVFESYEETYESLKTNLKNFIDTNNYIVSGIVLFKENLTVSTFTFLSDEQSKLFNVQEDDPELETWEKFKDFVLFLQNDLNIEYFDLLMCELYSNENWKYVIDTIDITLMTLNIRSSDDKTGNLIYDSDWILESEHVDIDLVNMYFNKNVYDLKIILGGITRANVLVMDMNSDIYFTGHNHDLQFGTIGNSNGYFTKIPLPTLKTNEKVISFSAYTNKGGKMIIVTNQNRIFGQGSDRFYGFTDDFPMSIDTLWTELDNSFLYSDENIIECKLSCNGASVKHTLLLTDYGRVFFAGLAVTNVYNIPLKSPTNIVDSKQTKWCQINIPDDNPVIEIFNNSRTIFKTKNKKFYMMSLDSSGFEELIPPKNEVIKTISIHIVKSQMFIITESNKLYVKGTKFDNFNHGLENTVTNVTYWTEVRLSTGIELSNYDAVNEYPTRIVHGAHFITHVITNLNNYYNIGHHGHYPDTFANRRGNAINENTSEHKKKWSHINSAIDGTTLSNSVAKVFSTGDITHIITVSGDLLATGKGQNDNMGVGCYYRASLANNKPHRKKFDFCRTDISTIQDNRLQNIKQYNNEPEYIDINTPAPKRLVTFDSSGTKFDVTDYHNGDKTTITTYNSGDAVKVELYNDSSSNPVVRTTEPYPNGDIETLITYSNVHTKRITEYATGITITIVLNVDSNKNLTTETTTVDASSNTTIVYEYTDSNGYAVRETTYPSKVFEKFIAYGVGYTRKETTDVNGDLTIIVVSTNGITGAVTTTTTYPNKDVTIVVESTDNDGNNIVKKIFPPEKKINK